MSEFFSLSIIKRFFISCCCSYFNASSDESEDGIEGDSEEAVRQRIAKEFRYAESGANEEEEEEKEEEEDNDPLEAFMAGIEVCGWSQERWSQGR